MLRLLQMIEDYIRRTVIAWYFEYGQLPPTWAEVKASQTAQWTPREEAGETHRGKDESAH